jgi:putative endonuclease
MTASRQQLGRRAEDLVARRLTAAGWELLARNARSRYGELDIVARDGRALVFVEVKAARAGARFGPERPVLAVDARKQQRLRRLATAWLAANRGRGRYAAIRFDVVGVTYDGSGQAVAVEHIEAAF